MVSCSLLIPCTFWQHSSLFTPLPVFSAPSSSLALSGSTALCSLPCQCAAPSSTFALSGRAALCSLPNQYLLLPPQPLYSLEEQLSVHSQTSVCCSLLIPCTYWQSSSLFTPQPVFSAPSSSLALSVYSSYQWLLLSPHSEITALRSIIRSLLAALSVSLLATTLILLCHSTAVLLASVTSYTVLPLSCVFREVAIQQSHSPRFRSQGQGISFLFANAYNCDI